MDAPPKNRGGREVGLACLHTGGAPCRAGESQNLPSAAPLPSWRALGSRFPVRKIRFGSAGWLKNPHASDLKGKGAQEKLSTNVKITQPGVCLPRPCWSRDVHELRAGRSRLEVSRGALRCPVRTSPQRLGARGRNNCLTSWISAHRPEPSPVRTPATSPGVCPSPSLPPSQRLLLHICVHVHIYIYI